MQTSKTWVDICNIPFSQWFLFHSVFYNFFHKYFCYSGDHKIIIRVFISFKGFKIFSMGTIIGINLKFWQKLLYYLMMSWETDMVKKDVMVSHREKSILSKMKWFVLVHPLQLQNFHFKWFWTWPSAEHQHTTWNLLG